MTRLLRPLVDTDAAGARDAHSQLAREGFPFLLELREGEDWPDYVARLERMRSGQDLAEGRVPATFLVAEVGGELVGRVSVRHTLTPALERVGGHVGYAVLPRHRRRGHATAMLRHGLGVARSYGVQQALVTCDVDNLGSAAVIEICGGVLTDVAELGPGVSPVRRYLVPTAA